MQPVITSLLDTDLYKFTMWQALLHRHPQTQSEYRFVCRNQPIYPLAELLPEVNAALDHLCTLRFSEDELAYLGGLRFIKSDFIDFLRIFQFQRNFIRAWAEGDQLLIVAQGPQVHVMGFEIPVLAIVNELHFRRLDRPAVREEGRRRLAAKIEQLQRAAADPGAARLSAVASLGVEGCAPDVVGSAAEAAVAVTGLPPTPQAPGWMSAIVTQVTGRRPSPSTGPM